MRAGSRALPSPPTSHPGCDGGRPPATPTTPAIKTHPFWGSLGLRLPPASLPKAASPPCSPGQTALQSSPLPGPSPPPSPGLTIPCHFPTKPELCLCCGSPSFYLATPSLETQWLSSVGQNQRSQRSPQLSPTPKASSTHTQMPYQGPPPKRASPEQC